MIKDGGTFKYLGMKVTARARVPMPYQVHVIINNFCGRLGGNEEIINQSVVKP